MTDLGAKVALCFLIAFLVVAGLVVLAQSTSATAERDTFPSDCAKAGGEVLHKTRLIGKIMVTERSCQVTVGGRH